LGDAVPTVSGPGALGEESAAGLASRVRSIAWDRLGLLRDAEGLREAAAALEKIAGRKAQERVTRSGVEARNLRDVASHISAAALRREESRGAHCRNDRPDRDDGRFRRSFAQRCGGGVWEIPIDPRSGRDGS
jgi:aspartate oxidase